MNTEIVILTNLLHNEEYFQRVLPFLKSEYFSDLGERTVFEKMASFADTYGEPPTPDAIRLALQKDSTLTDALFNETIDLVDALVPTERLNVDWLLDETEEFCRKKALRNAIHQSMKVMEGNDKTLSPDAIPSLLQDALAITFDPSVGHDYTEDVDERYDNYHQVQERIPFSVDMFNTVTRGGIPKKTLNVIMAGVGVGKTIFMCDFAANAFLAGKNVLYITLEMSDHSIAERIDANLIGVNVDDLHRWIEKCLRSG
jgi:replicative DNA helicase